MRHVVLHEQGLIIIYDGQYVSQTYASSIWLLFYHHHLLFMFYNMTFSNGVEDLPLCVSLLLELCLHSHHLY